MTEQKQFLAKAIQYITEGHVPGVSGSLQQQARDLLSELQRPQLRPGVLGQAKSFAEETFVSAGRLRQGESLFGEMQVPVKQADGRQVTVAVPRHGTVQQLRNAINSATACGPGAGLLLSGRPLTDQMQLFDLWLRDGLGSPSSGATVHIQLTVRNVGG